MSLVVIYFLLNSLSLLGDSIFLYFISLNLLQAPGGGMLCSIVLGLDAFFEILVGPYFSRFIDVIPKLCERLRRSFILQVAMMAIAMLPAMVVQWHAGNLVALILVVAVMRFFCLINTQLKAALPLQLDKQAVMPLMQTLSLSVFSQRCIFLVSSALAPYLLGASWLFACTLNGLLYIPALFGLYLIIQLAKQLPPLHLERQVEVLENEEGERKKWISWNCTLQLLGNIAFSSVVLVLTKSMLAAEGESKIIQALKGPAPTYCGLLVALLLMMFLHKKTSRAAKSAKRVCYLMCSLGVTLCAAALTTSFLQASVFFLAGIINGFSLVSGDTFIQRKLEGKNFVAALAKSQAFGKLGVLISLGLAGLCIDLGFSSSSIITIYGSIGIFISVLLFIQATNLENSQTAKILNQ